MKLLPHLMFKDIATDKKKKKYTKEVIICLNLPFKVKGQIPLDSLDFNRQTTFLPAATHLVSRCYSELLVLRAHFLSLHPANNLTGKTASWAPTPFIERKRG